jgi:large subunit ribosomal protein L30
MSKQTNGGNAGKSGGPTFKVTLVRSTIGRPKTQALTVRSMGLRKLNQTIELPDNPSMRGMVAKVRHLVEVQESDETA